MDTTAIKIIDTIKTIDPTPFYNQVAFWISLISLAIATTAILWPALKERNKTKRRESIFKEHFFQILELGIVQSENRIKYYSELSSEISNINKSNYFFKISPKLFQNAIDRLNSNEIFSIIYNINKKSISELFYDLYNVMDYLKNEEDAFADNATQFKNDFRKYNSELRNKINDGIIHATELLYEIKSTNKNYKSDEFYRDLENKLNIFSAKKIKNINDIYDLSIHVSNICLNHFNRNEARKLYSFFSDTERRYLDIRNIKDIYSKSFEEEIPRLVANKEKLEYIKNELSK